MKRRAGHDFGPADQEGIATCRLCGLAASYVHEMRGECPEAEFVEVSPERRQAGKRAKRRGQRGEYQVRDLFIEAGFPLRRTPMSGGMHVKGDLTGLEGVHLEVKYQERWSLPAWLDQAQRDASAGEMPVVVFRRSRGDWFATVPLKDFIGLLVEARRSEEAA